MKIIIALFLTSILLSINFIGCSKPTDLAGGSSDHGNSMNNLINTGKIDCLIDSTCVGYGSKPDGYSIISLCDTGYPLTSSFCRELVISAEFPLKSFYFDSLPAGTFSLMIRDTSRLLGAFLKKVIVYSDSTTSIKNLFLEDMRGYDSVIFIDTSTNDTSALKNVSLTLLGTPIQIRTATQNDSVCEIKNIPYGGYSAILKQSTNEIIKISDVFLLGIGGMPTGGPVIDEIKVKVNMKNE